MSSKRSIIISGLRTLLASSVLTFFIAWKVVGLEESSVQIWECIWHRKPKTYYAQCCKSRPGKRFQHSVLLMKFKYGKVKNWASPGEYCEMWCRWWNICFATLIQVIQSRERNVLRVMETIRVKTYLRYEMCAGLLTLKEASFDNID